MKREKPKKLVIRLGKARLKKDWVKVWLDGTTRNITPSIFGPINL
jgi:hypothetical protein